MLLLLLLFALFVAFVVVFFAKSRLVLVFIGFWMLCLPAACKSSENALTAKEIQRNWTEKVLHLFSHWIGESIEIPEIILTKSPTGTIIVPVQIQTALNLKCLNQKGGEGGGKGWGIGQ